MIDLTSALARDSHQAVHNAIHAVYGSREVIEQAKGIIMAIKGVGPEQAFHLLSEQSQNTNTKLSAVAAALVSAATRGALRRPMAQWAPSPTPQ
jgi:AmiR/NasT family two-component response regulator